MSLIARLKAAHEAATPGPWEGALRSSMSIGMDGSQARIDGELIVLLRNNADSIIAALEEREQMRAVVEAARNVAENFGTSDPGTSHEDDRTVNWALAAQLHAALDALEKKG